MRILNSWFSFRKWAASCGFFGVQQASWEHGGHGTTFAINQLPNKQGYQSNLWIAAEMFVLDMPKVLRQCDILRRVSGLVSWFFCVGVVS